MRSTSAHEPGVPTVPREPLLRDGDLLDGRYVIGPRLGGGGMATVFRATQVALARPVAVKIVSPLVRDVPGIASRFLREARAATRLKSEHVVRVFDVGMTPDGAPYMVMELLEGKDLAQLLDDGFAPSLEEVIDYVLQACEALAEVHGVGIIHRDLKPANLFVTRGADGLACVKLIDFGISRFDAARAGAPLGLEPEPEPEAAEPSAWSGPEIVVGSPRYMAPEQMESAAAADARADIWGLGAILYELLVGHAPFDGESLFDIYAAALRAPPPRPSALRPGLPRAIDRVTLDCLRVDPADRHADVAELARKLARLGGAGATARAEAIARVLEAARDRSGEATREPLRAPERAPSAPQRRASVALRPRVLLGAAAVALFGAGLAARPIARAVHVAPTVVVTEASASGPGEARPAMPLTRMRATTLLPPRWSPPELAPATLEAPAPSSASRARPRVDPGTPFEERR